jgi:hypothetical protein
VVVTSASPVICSRLDALPDALDVLVVAQILFPVVHAFSGIFTADVTLLALGFICHCTRHSTCSAAYFTSRLQLGLQFGAFYVTHHGSRHISHWSSHCASYSTITSPGFLTLTIQWQNIVSLVTCNLLDAYRIGRMDAVIRDQRIVDLSDGSLFIITTPEAPFIHHKFGSFSALQHYRPTTSFSSKLWIEISVAGVISCTLNTPFIRHVSGLFLSADLFCPF